MLKMGDFAQIKMGNIAYRKRYSPFFIDAKNPI